MGLVVGCRGAWTGDEDRPGPCQCAFCAGERLSSPSNHDWGAEEPSTPVAPASDEPESGEGVDQDSDTIFGIDRDLVKGMALAFLLAWARRQTESMQPKGGRLRGLWDRWRKRISPFRRKGTRDE